MTADALTSSEGFKIDWTRLIALLTGFGLFLLIYYSPPWPDAVDPLGKHFVLSTQGKGAVAVFALAAIWWVFEVVPIGVTSLVIGVTQALFMIRPAKEAFNDFMDPAVLFIFASLVIGMVFNKTGLTKRMAYKMLGLVGEKTTTIYLGVFLLVALLTHIMAHTGVAATVYPLLLAIYSLYGEGDKPTKFGKGLFIGMAYVCRSREHHYTARRGPRHRGTGLLQGDGRQGHKLSSSSPTTWRRLGGQWYSSSGSISALC